MRAGVVCGAGVAQGATVPVTRLRRRDAAALGVVGIRTRPVRAVLTAIGIGVGVAALVAVVGVSQTSRARLLAEIDRLGTDVLEVAPGQRITGEQATLGVEATAMIGRIDGVRHAGAVSALDATVRRNDRIDAQLTGGIAVAATDPELLAATRSRLRAGRFLDASGTGLPVVVLGSVAAQRLGVDDVSGAPMVWLAERWFAVIGVLEPNPIADQLDRTALVGEEFARTVLEPGLSPDTIYVRTTPDEVDHVRALLAATAKPAAPSEVRVVRPADALLARAAAETALSTLLLGLGAVTVVVGGIGVANVMIIAVLERRAEIGVRRALGATGGHIVAQFLLESVVLGAAGGVLGVGGGALFTAGHAVASGGHPVLSVTTLLAGVVVAAGVAAIAGLYPAVRAARLTPVEALR